MLELDSHLTLRSHIQGYGLTVVDLFVWGAVRGNKIAHAAIKKGAMLNVSRWFKYIDEANPWIAEALQTLNAQALEKKSAKSKEGGSYDIALPDTQKGVVTRFPPEPSCVLPNFLFQCQRWLTETQWISSYRTCQGSFTQ